MRPDNRNAAERSSAAISTDRSYFVKAIESGRSSYLGVDPVSRRVRYYLAEAIKDPALLGVAVVRIEFDTLESTWERGGERVLITDADGVVFLTSTPAYKYRIVRGAIGQHLATEAATPNFPSDAKRAIEIAVHEAARRAIDRSSVKRETRTMPSSIRSSSCPSSAGPFIASSILRRWRPISATARSSARRSRR